MNNQIPNFNIPGNMPNSMYGNMQPFHHGMNNNDEIRNLEMRVNRLEREVRRLEGKINYLEQGNKGSYGSNTGYQPNSYNMF